MTRTYLVCCHLHICVRLVALQQAGEEIGDFDRFLLGFIGLFVMRRLSVATEKATKET